MVILHILHMICATIRANRLRKRCRKDVFTYSQTLFKYVCAQIICVIDYIYQHICLTFVDCKHIFHKGASSSIAQICATYTFL